MGGGRGGAPATASARARRPHQPRVLLLCSPCLGPPHPVRRARAPPRRRPRSRRHAALRLREVSPLGTVPRRGGVRPGRGRRPRRAASAGARGRAPG
ncbi:hypothetical protein EE612_027884 [Oryza sativa]|nr:hypothetical protein EE612_027884 [Oryza sativa]